jgi:hypothetical protein
VWYCGSVQGLHCSFYEVLKLKAAIKFPISLWMSLQNVCFSEPELFWIVLWNHELLVYKCKYNQCHWIAGHSIFAFQLGALFVWWQLLFIYLFILIRHLTFSYISNFRSYCLSVLPIGPISYWDIYKQDPYEIKVLIFISLKISSFFTE